jgi:hypothetical protein
MAKFVQGITHWGSEGVGRGVPFGRECHHLGYCNARNLRLGRQDGVDRRVTLVPVDDGSVDKPLQGIFVGDAT